MNKLYLHCPSPSFGPKYPGGIATGDGGSAPASFTHICGAMFS